MASLGIVFAIALPFCHAFNVHSPPSIAGTYYHVNSGFGPEVDASGPMATTPHNLVLASPDSAACQPLSESAMKGNIVLILRGASVINNVQTDPRHSCRFTTKVYMAQKAGALAAIIGNNEGEHDIVPMFESNTHHPDIQIPSIAVSHTTYKVLEHQLQNGENVTVDIGPQGTITDSRYDDFIERWITAVLATLVCLALMSLFLVAVLSLKISIDRYFETQAMRRRRERINEIPTIRYSARYLIDQEKANHLLSEETATENETKEFKEVGTMTDDVESVAGDEEEVHLMEATEVAIESNVNVAVGNADTTENEDLPMLHNETCNVCLDDFEEGEEIKVLRCSHGFHDSCIRNWVIDKGLCPVCKRHVFPDQPLLFVGVGDETTQDQIDEFDRLFGPYH